MKPIAMLTSSRARLNTSCSLGGDVTLYMASVARPTIMRHACPIRPKNPHMNRVTRTADPSAGDEDGVSAKAAPPTIGMRMAETRMARARKDMVFPPEKHLPSEKNHNRFSSCAVVGVVQFET